MAGSSNWWSEAYKVNSWLTGTLLVVGFISGMGAFAAGMKYFRQEMVTADTYILKRDKDYISPEIYARVVQERDDAIKKRDEASRHSDELDGQLKQRDALIVELGDRKRAIADLENMRADAEKKLKAMNLQLAMESEMTVIENRNNVRQDSSGSDLYQGTKREIYSIEQNMRDIDQRILELKSLGK